LLPALIHAASGPFINDLVWPAVAGVVISNAALTAAMLYLLELVSAHHGKSVAIRTVLYLLVFPTTFFLSAPYPHSLLLLGVLGAIYHAERGDWGRAALLAAVAASARLYGVAVLVPLAIVYFRSEHSSRRAVALCTPILASAICIGWIGWQAGDPLAALSAGGAWGRLLTPPWDVVRAFLTQPGGLALHGYRDSLLELVNVCLVTTGVILSWRRLRPPMAALATALLMPMVTSGILASTLRYDLELAPLFILLAKAGIAWRPFHLAYLAAALVLSALAMGFYAAGGWVA
jgi:hypothetical protein